jgi:hypothetical protein
MGQKNAAKPKIIIDATSRIFYASFYIKGFTRSLWQKKCVFLAQNLKDLNRKGGAFTFEHYFAFKIVLLMRILRKL